MDATKEATIQEETQAEVISSEKMLEMAAYYLKEEATKRETTTCDYCGRNHHSMECYL